MKARILPKLNLNNKNVNFLKFLIEININKTKIFLKSHFYDNIKTILTNIQIFDEFWLLSIICLNIKKT